MEVPRIDLDIGPATGEPLFHVPPGLVFDSCTEAYAREMGASTLSGLLNWTSRALPSDVWSVLQERAEINAFNGDFSR